jgi:hypothetical protein
LATTTSSFPLACFFLSTTSFFIMTGTAAAAAAPTQSEVSDVLQERLIDAEYKIWKKNTPYL